MRALVCLCLCLGCAAVAQAPTPVPLATLIAEAERASPEVRAAEADWRAAVAAVTPARTLPDPQVEVQQMSVGNPLPFAGFESSNFAYIGVGASQPVPYPGKLKLRGAIATSHAAAAQAELAGVRRRLAGEVAAAYVQLGYRARIAALLDAEGRLLAQAEHAARARYAAGDATQAEVIAAQAEQARLLARVTRNQVGAETVQADLRGLLNRPESSPPVAVAPLQPSPSLDAAALRQDLDAGDPALAAARADVAAAAGAAALARLNAKPDFNLQYMYERTGPGFPDYYQWTVGLSLPLHRAGRVRPLLEQAAENSLATSDRLEARRRSDQATLDQLLLTAQGDERIMRLEDVGLLPQSRAAAGAALAAFAAGRGNLAAVLDADRQTLALEEQYWETVAGRETALAQIQALTGGGDV